MTDSSPRTALLLEAVSDRMNDHLDLLERLVAIPSHASTPGGTDEVASEIVPILESLGFGIDTHIQTPLPDGLRWVETIMIPGQRQEDLGQTYAATREGESGTRVLLLGDLDTSYPKPAHEAFPARREGSRFYGPGIADMKGGLVVLVAALRALADSNTNQPGVEIVLAADEQAGSLGSRRIIEESAARCEWTLCVECGRRGGKLMAARGHIGIGDLTASGVEAHAGSAYEEGVNATDLLARVIPAVNDLSRPDDGILVTVTILEAGRRRSVIPDKAWAVLDIRTPSPPDWDQTVAAIRETVASHGEGRVEARTYAHRPGVPWSSNTDRLLELIKRQGLAIGVELSAFASAANGSVAFAGLTESVIMDGLGPVGGGLMTHDEHIEVPSIPERAAILAATIDVLGRPV